MLSSCIISHNLIHYLFMYNIMRCLDDTYGLTASEWVFEMNQLGICKVKIDRYTILDTS